MQARRKTIQTTDSPKQYQTSEAGTPFSETHRGTGKDGMHVGSPPR
jgi:hypothetical protein